MDYQQRSNFYLRVTIPDDATNESYAVASPVGIVEIKSWIQGYLGYIITELHVGATSEQIQATAFQSSQLHTGLPRDPVA